jgi:hypothetical protein
MLHQKSLAIPWRVVVEVRNGLYVYVHEKYKLFTVGFYSFSISCRYMTYTVKKRLATFPSPAGMSLTKLYLCGNNLIIPAQGEFDKWHPAGDGNVSNLFLRCTLSCLVTKKIQHSPVTMAMQIRLNYVFSLCCIDPPSANSNIFFVVTSSAYSNLPLNWRSKRNQSSQTVNHWLYAGKSVGRPEVL